MASTSSSSVYPQDDSSFRPSSPSTEEEDESDSDGEILCEEIVNDDGESEMILVPQREVSLH